VIRLTNEGRVTRHRRTHGRQTKSGRSRSFPINEALATALKKITKEPDGLIYHGPPGGRLKPDTARNVFLSEVIEPLKAKFPSAPVAVGFTRMDWLGHADSKLVTHYIHLYDQEARRHMARLDFAGGGPGGVAGPGSGRRPWGKRDPRMSAEAKA
jgi:integrase